LNSNKTWFNPMRRLLSALKQRARTNGLVQHFIHPLRVRSVERPYRRRREYYARKKIVPSPSLRDAKHKRSIGNVHTFALFPSVSWHETLLPELALLGPVDRFDYADLVRLGHRQRHSAEFQEFRRRINSEAIQAFERAHQKQPVDWLFAYAQGNHIVASTIETIRERYGVPCVNMSLDDKQSWDMGMIGEQRQGSIGLVSAFDLWWTSARVTVDWVNAEGGRAIYLPEGCSPETYYPTDQQFDIPVSFLGANYGSRPKMIHFLGKHGMPVHIFGHGWKSTGGPSWVEAPVDIFRRSQINLGNGGVLHSERITSVKGRDFDIPSTGGGLYLTTYNADLAQHFRIGEEILCWHSHDEMLELLRYYLPRPDECREIAHRARQRCLSEHRWSHRYIRILQELGILDEGTQPPAIASASLVSQPDHTL